MYKLKDVSEANLTNQGFRQIADGWLISFPVYFYRKNPITFCTAIIRPDESKRLIVDVRRANGSPHPDWYQNNPQAKDVVDEINKNISIKMKKIGARWYRE